MKRGHGWDLRQDAVFPLSNSSADKQRAARAETYSVYYNADVVEDGWRKQAFLLHTEQTENTSRPLQTDVYLIDSLPHKTL